MNLNFLFFPNWGLKFALRFVDLGYAGSVV